MHADEVAELRSRTRGGKVTLVYAAHDSEHKRDSARADHLPRLPAQGDVLRVIRVAAVTYRPSQKRVARQARLPQCGARTN